MDLKAGVKKLLEIGDFYKWWDLQYSFNKLELNEQVEMETVVYEIAQAVNPYKTLPTVVVVAIPVFGGGVVLIRRNLADGFGGLALPGGYQSNGEDWKETAVREVKEETGLKIDKEFLKLLDVVTVPEANLIFCQSEKIYFPVPYNLDHDAEVSEVLISNDWNTKLVYPTHEEIYKSVIVQQYQEHSKMMMEMKLKEINKGYGK